VKNKFAFTLVEMLMALLVVSVILSASLPVITKRMNERIGEYNRYNSFPIGGIIVWGTDKALPDNTWLECNGQAIPNGIEYEEIRRIYGTNLPDYRGVFLRGYGSVVHTQNNGSIVGETATTHASGDVGVIQGDASRDITGIITGYTAGGGGGIFDMYNNTISALFASNYKAGGAQNIDGVDRYSVLQLAASRVIPTANEIRPVNKAVRYIIKVRN